MGSNGQSPDLDMEKGIQQFGGNEDLYMSILGFFVSDMHALLISTEPITEEGLDVYAQTAHAIKGSSRSVYADNLGNAAEKIEIAAKNGDYEYVNANHEAFFGEAKKLVQDIEEMLAEKGIS